MTGTIFGQPTGKWQLGTDVGGREAALMGKWIGEAPLYPTMAVQTPSLATSPLGWLALGAAIVYLLTRKKG